MTSVYKNHKSVIDFMLGVGAMVLALNVYMYYDNSIREINGHGYATLNSITQKVKVESLVVLEIHYSLSDNEVTPEEFSRLTDIYNKEYGPLEIPPITVGTNIGEQYSREDEKTKLLKYFASLTKQ